MKFLFRIFIFTSLCMILSPAQGSDKCLGACKTLSKQCDEFCSLAATTISKCQDFCFKTFESDKGYCQSGCKSNSQFLAACSEDSEAADKIEDDCVFSCEDHNGACILSCRSNYKEGSKEIQPCYDSCNKLFTEEEGFCKFQCRTDFNFMESCEE